MSEDLVFLSHVMTKHTDLHHFIENKITEPLQISLQKQPCLQCYNQMYIFIFMQASVQSLDSPSILSFY